MRLVLIYKQGHRHLVEDSQAVMVRLQVAMVRLPEVTDHRQGAMGRLQEEAMEHHHHPEVTDHRQGAMERLQEEAIERLQVEVTERRQVDMVAKQR